MGYIPPPAPSSTEYLDTDSPLGVGDPHIPDLGAPVVSSTLQTWVFFALGIVLAWLWLR